MNTKYLIGGVAVAGLIGLLAFGNKKKEIVVEVPNNTPPNLPPVIVSPVQNIPSIPVSAIPITTITTTYNPAPNSIN
jgi:hypothetical protein